MVYNQYIKCDVCGKITRIRLQVGIQKEHPIAITCGKCGISLKGKVFINQEKPDLRFEFDNATQLECLDEPDYAVECSGEFVTFKMCEGSILHDEVITPFIRYQQKIDKFENYEKFMQSLSTLMRTIDIWPRYDRILQLWKYGNKEYLVQEIKKIFPIEFASCRDELEIIRGVRMVEVHSFLSPLKPEISKLSEIGASIFKLRKKEIKFLIDFLNQHNGFSLVELQNMINKLLGEFVTVFSYLVPAFSLQFCDNKLIDFEKEGTTTSTYSDVKQFYLDVYETLGNLLIIPTAIDNICYRNDADIFACNDVNIDSLEKFISATKACRFHLYNSDEIYMRTLNIKCDQKLRNAIGHNDIEYDTSSQKITYIPNPKKRDKKLTKYLLEFEMEALAMFQSVLVVSEYLYRLREVELIDKGVARFKEEFAFEKIYERKIYPNEPCPCGSGKKYKHCHGKHEQLARTVQ